MWKWSDSHGPRCHRCAVGESLSHKAEAFALGAVAPTHTSTFEAALSVCESERPSASVPGHFDVVSWSLSDSEDSGEVQLAEACATPESIELENAAVPEAALAATGITEKRIPLVQESVMCDFGRSQVLGKAFGKRQHSDADDSAGPSPVYFDSHWPGHAVVLEDNPCGDAAAGESEKMEDYPYDDSGDEMPPIFQVGAKTAAPDVQPDVWWRA